jgi:hypothetical protein|tara:strand:+ start:1461 stop:1625 length:165 start_codon:yes stop_codon:yes gene_type:complete
MNAKGFWEAHFKSLKLTIIYIPAGSFSMDNDKLTSAVTNSMPANPVHKVSLSGY